MDVGLIELIGGVGCHVGGSFVVGVVMVAVAMLVVVIALIGGDRGLC